MKPNNSLQNNQAIKDVSFNQFIKSDKVLANIEKSLGKKSNQFVASLTSVVNETPKLQDVNPISIVQTAMIASSLDLPLNKSLGMAWLVPYGKVAQFQIGYKGLVQLAIRSGQYKYINVVEVKENELISRDYLTSMCEIKWNDSPNRHELKTVGYIASFETINGFLHTEYMTVEEVDTHAKKYSQAYAKGYNTPWKTDFDAMAKKTVLKKLISGWGIMSVEMQTALTDDQVTIDNNGNKSYVDNEENNVIDIEVEEVSENEEIILPE